MAGTDPHLSEQELSDFAAGRLNDRVIKRVEDHLLHCSDCGHRFDKWLGGDAFAARLRKMSDFGGAHCTTEIDGRGGDLEPSADVSRPDDRLIGRTFGNHRLSGVLGRGGMGVVYRATDSVIGRDVAIKVLHESVAGDRDARTRFISEARSQGQLNHPNVVTIYEIDELDSTMYIVMELANGGSVGNRLRDEGALPWYEATRILMQACRGLAAAHSGGLIHRDIKPENLLIAENGQVKLSDFGLAKPVDAASITHTGQLVGTPQFMSPEQCRSETVDLRSDIYQLGATYYSLLTAQRPYEYAATPLQAIEAHCRNPVPDPREVNPDLSDDCADIISEAMAKLPQDRYQTADELFADLIALHDSSTKLETVPNTVDQPQPPNAGGDQRTGDLGSRERKRDSRAAALVFILLAAMGLLGYVNRSIEDSSSADPAEVIAPTISFDADAVPIKIGVLHSLTGTMSKSESPLVDAIALAVEEINQKGGLLGRPVQQVVADGRSDSRTFLQQAVRLITEEDVCTVFGCWTSASRKTVVPIFENHNHLLIYPVQYEGLEQSPNVIYTGAAPNQQIIPAVKWAYAFQDKRRFFLVGSDYVFPRTANEIIKDVLSQLGDAELVGEEYIPLASSNVQSIVTKITAARPDVILNTINGDSNIAFFRSLRSAGVTPLEIPTISFSVSEVELQSLGAKHMVGDYASWNYFQSIDSQENHEFVERFRARFGSHRVISDPMEASYVGVRLWAQAVATSGETDAGGIREAIRGAELEAPQGHVRIDPETQHAFKMARIGRVTSDGQFELVWQEASPQAPQPYPTTRTVAQWDSFLKRLQTGWGGRWSSADGE